MLEVKTGSAAAWPPIERSPDTRLAPPDIGSPRRRRSPRGPRLAAAFAARTTFEIPSQWSPAAIASAACGSSPALSRTRAGARLGGRSSQDRAPEASRRSSSAYIAHIASAATRITGFMGRSANAGLDPPESRRDSRGGFGEPLREPPGDNSDGISNVRTRRTQRRAGAPTVSGGVTEIQYQGR